MREWLARSGVRHGRVFRSLCRGAVGKRLDASQVPRIFKAMAHHGGLPVEVVERISGHSTRVGAAQDMVAGGIGMAAILHAGRWKTTTMVNRYSGGACSATVSEADGEVALGALLDKDVAFPVSITLGNVPVSATAGNDYVEADADRALDFPALTQTSNFRIGIVDDDPLENVEAFHVQSTRNGLDQAITLNTGWRGSHGIDSRCRLRCSGRVGGYTNTRQATATTKARVKPTIHFSSAWLPSSRVTAFSRSSLVASWSKSAPAAARSCSAWASACLRSIPAASSARVAARVSKLDAVDVGLMSGPSCTDCVPRSGFSLLPVLSHET